LEEVKEMEMHRIVPHQAPIVDGVRTMEEFLRWFREQPKKLRLVSSKDAQAQVGSLPDCVFVFPDHDPTKILGEKATDTGHAWVLRREGGNWIVGWVPPSTPIPDTLCLLVHVG
jgi:hypothetical protein